MQRTSSQNRPSAGSDVESYSLAYALNLLVQIYSAKCAVSIKAPHSNPNAINEILPEYDDGGLLKTVKAKLRGSASETDFVTGISYNPKGQRERIRYGNGATTKYEYDDKNFRLTSILTTRSNGTNTLQDLNYEYDEMGNITAITDNAQQTIFFNGQVVNPSQTFEYDALYRLTKATGREHINNNAGTEPEDGGYPHAHTQIPANATALRNYTREWEYDEVGNIMKMIHQINSGNWYRTYNYSTADNRLLSTKVGNNATVNYTYNQHGSMASMPHLQNMEWDFAERLSHITKGTTEAYYNYDGSGERVRKIVEKDGVVETRLYLGGFEIFRKKNGNALELERETLHIMDNFESNEPKESEKDKEAEGFENNTPRIMNTKRRVAIVETKTWENYVQTANPIPMQRYQLSNNIESATLELDETANIISYEEYYPYGDTSYQAGRSAIEVSQKHYRYTGKEKDEESGLYYHGARYYACWLGRWTASDPARLVDGTNLYMYCRGNSVGFKDPYGFKAQSSEYHGGRYTLFVSPQYLDFSQSLIGAIPVLGLPFSVLNMAGQRLLGGFRDIDYNVTETLGIALGTIEHINNSDILKTMSNWAGKTLDAVEIAKYPYDWYGTKNYQIEEAIYNHFDRYIWISDNRDFVDLKFNYAMQCITSMLATGSIEIRKAVDFFGESEFNNGETYQYDSLKGKYNSFNKDDYYFFATDGAASDNSISKLEEIIRLF